MALLSKTNRDKYLKALGYGAYSEKSILALQKAYFPHYTTIGKTKINNWDGIYGTDTDNLLRHCYNVFKVTKNFKPAEFKCGCGNKYCNGYPTYMRQNVLTNIQAIRSHWGKPITVTCGLRCSSYNKSLGGSVSNSKHLSGKAIDFYQKGVTDTLANRKKSIKWIKKLADHSYTYGNGINSSGSYVNAPNMGNALHTDTK